MAQEHTVKAFDDDITRLRGLIAEMGGLVEVALDEALEALVRGNEDMAQAVIARDKRIDTLEMEVDRLAVRVIALRAPMADLHLDDLQVADQRISAVRIADLRVADPRVADKAQLERPRPAAPDTAITIVESDFLRTPTAAAAAR